MKTALSIFLLVLFNIGATLTLFFVVRVFAAPFSPKVRAQIERHPRLHLLWFGLVAVFVAAVFILPGMIEKSHRKARLRQLRESTAQQVQAAGGWEALRRECVRFAAEHQPEHRRFWRGRGEVTNQWPIINSLAPFWVDAYPSNALNKGEVVSLSWGSRRTGRFTLVVTSSDTLELPTDLFVPASGQVRCLTNGVFEVTRGY